MIDLNQLFQTQSSALSIPAYQTQSCTRIGVMTILVIWQASTANHSVRCLATRPAMDWFLSLLPRWADTCTAPMPRSGLFLPSLTHHQPLWAEGRGKEEEVLLPRERRARRRTGKKGTERRTKSRTRVQKSSSLSTWQVYHFCTIVRSIHSLSGIQFIYTISQYMSDEKSRQRRKMGGGERCL